MQRRIVMGVALVCFACNLGWVAYALGGAAWLLLWPAVAAAWVGAGYLGLGARIYGKDASTGALAAPSMVVLAPWLAFQWGVWRLEGVLGREPPHQLAHPRVWLGRRPAPGALPPGVDLVVDLTAEFPAVRLPPETAYLCAPTLDATAPSLDALREVVERLAAHEGQAYVHCASGHGRSTAVVVGVLLRIGAANSVGEAEAALRDERPGVRLNSAQREQVGLLCAQGRAG